MTRHTYLETRLPLQEEPLLLMARLARSGLFEPYVVYESGDAWSLAGGALAEVRLSGQEARDLSQVKAGLAEIPVADWRAYGWARSSGGPRSPEPIPATRTRCCI